MLTYKFTIMMNKAVSSFICNIWFKNKMKMKIYFIDDNIL